MDWDDFPVILGFGSCHDMRDADGGSKPRLWDMKSVSASGAIGLHKKEAPPVSRPIGFKFPKGSCR